MWSATSSQHASLHLTARKPAGAVFTSKYFSLTVHTIWCVNRPIIRACNFVPKVYFSADSVWRKRRRMIVGLYPFSGFSDGSYTSLLMISVTPSTASVASMGPVSLGTPCAYSVRILGYPEVSKTVVTAVFSPLQVHYGASGIYRVSGVTPGKRTFVRFPRCVRLLSSVYSVPYSSLLVTFAKRSSSRNAKV